MNKTGHIFRRIRSSSAALAFALLMTLVCFTRAVEAATTPEPLVAIHVSELTQALEATPDLWWPSWHYFVMPESLKEALRSDGTQYVEMSDAAIAAGGLLQPDGMPKYPILISLAAEAIGDDEIAPLLAYVNAGGILFMGSSAFTRTAGGAARTDFALANEMGLHFLSPELLNNWVQSSTFTKSSDHRLVSHIPSGTLNWRMPLNAAEIPLGVSPEHPIHGNHWVFTVAADGDATVLANSSAGVRLATRQYGNGAFIYDGTAQPLIGHGGYDPATYSYRIYRNAIEWAFENADIPIVKLSPWRYEHDAAFIVRHDFENDPARISLIEASASYEYSLGALGDYYFCTGTLREEMPDEKDAVILGLRSAVFNYGATIGSHNGGLKNPVNSELSIGDFDYWHWGPDEALTITSFPTGSYANGRAYAKDSILLSFLDIEGWLSGLDNGRTGCAALTSCPRSWAAPYFNATREGSYEIMEELGAEVASKGEQKLTPFPHWTLSYTVPGKRFNHISLPLSDWFVGANIPGALEWGHTTETMQAAVDYYYDLGGLVNLYGHQPSANDNLMGEYVAYSVSKPGIWSTNAVGIADWWQERSKAAVSSTCSITGSFAFVHTLITGATSTSTAIQVVIPNWEYIEASALQVLLDGEPADAADYRLTNNVVKIRVGNTTSAVDVNYPVSNPVPITTGLSPAVIKPDGTDFTLTVNGNRFVADSVVRWNGADRATTYVSSTQLTAAIMGTDIPSDSNASASVTVFNPAPRGGVSNAQAFTMDSTAPDTAIIGQPSNPTSQASASFSFNATERGTFECQIDGGGYTMCTSPATYSSLASSQTHTFTVRATDLAGNIDASPALYAWMIDSTPPNAPIVSGITPTNTTTPTWTWTTGGGDGSGTYRYQLDDPVLSNATTTIGMSYTASVLSAGTYTLYVQERDAVNNWSIAGSFAITIDLIAPTVLISAPSVTIAKNGTSVTYTVSYSNADLVTLANEDVTLNATDGAGGTVNVTGTGTAERTVTISSLSNNGTLGISIAAGTASDLAGNAALSSGPSTTFTVDTISPDTAITSQPSNPTNLTDASFTFTSTEAGTFECQIDGGGYGSCTSPKSYTSLASNQTHTFEVRAVDTAGNTDASPAAYTWMIDTVLPDTGITGQPLNPTNQTEASFTFTATETATFECQMDGGEYSSCTNPKSYTSLASNQTHTFDVRATDTAGNTDASPATFVWMVDTIVPDTSITGNPTNPTNQTDANFTFTSTEVGTFECQIDGGGYSTCTSPKSYTDLASNQTHTFNVRATDTAGNTDASPAAYTWMIDTVLPDTGITGQPLNPTNQTDANFTFTSTEVGTFECQIDGGGYSTCTSPKSYTDLASNQTHTFNVRATDTAGNTDASPAAYTWMIDTVLPDTGITGQPLNPTNQADANFTFTSTEVGTFECQIDGGGYSTCTSPKSYTSLASNQTHTFEVRATDTAGNRDASSATYTWMIDTVLPDTSIMGQPLNPTNQTDASFTFTATEIATFECQIDGGGYDSCTSPKSYTSLASNQTHTFEVRATDTAGNADASPAAYTWLIDTVLPDTTITGQPLNPINQTEASFTFTATETTIFECQIDGSEYTTCTSPATYSSLASNQTHTFTVRSSDLAGNTDASPAAYAWMIDTTAPDTNLTGTPTSPTNKRTAIFAFTGTEAGTFRCRMDDGAYTLCSSPRTYNSLESDQTHTFSVRAVDAAGNVDATPATYSWMIDTTVPDTNITGTPTNPTNKRTAVFAFTGSETGTFQCRMDSGVYALCSSPRTYNSLASNQTHTFSVRAVDAAGNVDATPAIYSWMIDTTAPDTNITDQPTSPTNKRTAIFAFTGSETGTFQCRMDSGVYALCSSPRTYNSLASNQTHTFSVRAVDAAGNVDATPAIYSWRIDTTAPTTSITGGRPANPTNLRSASFTFTGSEAGTFECQMDGKGYAACSSPRTFSNLASNQTHTFNVRAVDLAGNIDATPATCVWRIDTMAPNTSITGGQPANPTNLRSASFTFTGSEAGKFQCQMDGRGYAACSSPRTFSNLASNQTHTFNVRAVDLAGNIDATPATYAWRIDATAPTTGVTSQLTNATKQDGGKNDYLVR